jgi:hypothetical protein
MLLVLAAITVALLWLPIEPLAFIVGFSSLVPAVIWHGLATGRELRRGVPQA